MPITRKINLDRADRLQRMPVSLDSDLDRMAARLAARDVEIIDLSSLRIGMGQLQPPAETAGDPAGWELASDDDLAHFREGVARWYESRFGISLDPRHEIEIVPNEFVAMSLLALAFVDTGDVALIPDPGKPVYRGAIALSGGGAVPYYLWERNDFLPSFAGIEAGMAGRTRLMVLSYPHDPTTAMADINVLHEAVAFAKRQNMLLVFDASYTHIASGPLRPRGLLEVKGARGVGVEVFSLSRNFGVGNLPLTIVAGNKDAVNAVSFLSSATRLCPLRATVRMAEMLLRQGESAFTARLQRLETARRTLVETFTEMRWTPRVSPAVPYIWLSVPATAGAEGICRRMLKRTGIRLRPGTVFGERGEGFVRAAIPDDPELAETAAERLKHHAHLYQRKIPRARRLPTRRKSKGESPDSQ